MLLIDLINNNSIQFVYESKNTLSLQVTRFLGGYEEKSNVGIMFHDIDKRNYVGHYLFDYRKYYAYDTDMDAMRGYYSIIS